MTHLDWLIVGNLIAGALVGILFWELARSAKHWFAKPAKPETDYEQAGS